MTSHGALTAAIDLGDVQISYFDSSTGAGDTRPVLLFLHGSYDSKECWSSYLDLFMADGYRIVAWDQRALGGSSTPEGPYTIDMLLSDLTAFIDRLGLASGEHPITIIGHSLGGLLATLYVLDNPKHVNRLVLIGTSAAFKPSFRQNLRPEYIAEHLDEFFDSLSPYFFTEAHQHIKGRILGGWMEIPFQVYKDYVSGLRHPDIRDRIGSVKAPTLLIYGEQDRLTPSDEDGSFLLKALPDGRMTILPDCGHYVFLEDPDAVFICISRFLNETGS